MLIEHINNTTVITQEKITLDKLLSHLSSEYANYQNNNMIINLFSLSSITPAQIMEFLPLSEKHKKNKHSFVLVNPVVKYDDLPESLMVVPTLKEAHDILEMEEIERDLGF